MCLPITVKSQTATSLVIKGSVSESVVLSMPPAALSDRFQLQTAAANNSLRVLLSGKSSEATVIRIPLLVRSNTGYRISARIESHSVMIDHLLVSDVRGTGRFVAPAAINVTVAQQHDPFTFEDDMVQVANRLPLDLSKNFVLWSGPRISLAGLLNSPDNALEVFFLIGVTPEKQAGGWQLSLTFSGAPDRVF
jgi:hypothetical protein